MHTDTHVLVAVITILLCIHSSAMLCVELAEKRKVEAIVAKGLTQSMLISMNNDGEVTRDEFLVYLLTKLNKVDAPLIERLNTLFDECDIDQNGLLDMSDCKRHQKLRHNEHSAYPPS